MAEATTTTLFRATTAKDALTEVVPIGAQRMLTAALEAEVETYIEELKHVLDEQGHRLVVRNGHLPGREITTGIGPLEVRQPRVDDRRVDEEGELPRAHAAMQASTGRAVCDARVIGPWAREQPCLQGLGFASRRGANRAVAFRGAIQPAPGARLRSCGALRPPVELPSIPCRR